MSENNQYDINIETAKRAHDQEREFHTQVNQAAIDSGSLAVKTFLLINGGAAVAMLTFIGALAGHDRIGGDDLKRLTTSLIWFASGVGLAGLASGAAYLTNLVTANLSSGRARLWEWPYLGSPKKHHKVLRGIFMSAAIVAGLAALAAFICGMIDVRSAISELKIFTKT